MENFLREKTILDEWYKKQYLEIDCTLDNYKPGVLDGGEACRQQRELFKVYLGRLKELEQKYGVKVTS